MVGEIENLEHELKIAKERIEKLEVFNKILLKNCLHNIREFDEKEKQRAVERAKANNIYERKEDNREQEAASAKGSDG